MAWSGFALFQLESADDILSHIIWVKMLQILSADGQRVFYGVVLEKSIGAEYWSGVESDFGVAKRLKCSCDVYMAKYDEPSSDES